MANMRDIKIEPAAASARIELLQELVAFLLANLVRAEPSGAEQLKIVRLHMKSVRPSPDEALSASERDIWEQSWEQGLEETFDRAIAFLN
jgi:hypothetical protein